MCPRNVSVMSVIIAAQKNYSVANRKLALPETRSLHYLSMPSNRLRCLLLAKTTTDKPPTQ